MSQSATRLWTLCKDTERITAVMRPVDHQFQLELLSGPSGTQRVFSAVFSSLPAVRAAATSERELLEARGWKVVDEPGTKR